jgi:hypothetical protein
VLVVEESDEEEVPEGLVEEKTAEECVAFAEKEPKRSIVSLAGAACGSSARTESQRAGQTNSPPVSAANAYLVSPSICRSLSPHPTLYEPADTGHEVVQLCLSPAFHQSTGRLLFGNILHILIVSQRAHAPGCTKARHTETSQATFGSRESEDRHHPAAFRQYRNHRLA